ncbi:G protein complex alpha subunit GanA [Penicillium sp. IBT 16267x]|nr:G protein complex alpha subunit GanA [Penicillium sp. IBT 16267x]
MGIFSHEMFRFIRSKLDKTNGMFQCSQIDKQLKSEKKAIPKVNKILLLGAYQMGSASCSKILIPGLGSGGSGKSTIIKQMRIIYSGGFSENERLQARAIIFINLITAFTTLLRIMEEENLNFSTECVETSANLIRATNPGDFSGATMSVAVFDAMKDVWEDEGIQEVVAKSRHLPFHDNMIYVTNGSPSFYHSIGRMSAREWLPDHQDILRARLRTTGISETFLELGSMNCLVIDVGGQQSERKKWIQCFEDVRCLIFVAALSGYDQCLDEDRGSNRLQEAMSIFDSLFDLFQQKLLTSPFSQNFPDFCGSDQDVHAAAQFVNDRFLEMDRAQGREIYTHCTTATDTTLVKKPLKSVEGMIVLQNLASSLEMGVI